MMRAQEEQRVPAIAQHLSRQEGRYIQAAFRDLDIAIEPCGPTMSLMISYRAGKFDEHLQIVLHAKKHYVHAWSTTDDRLAHGVIRLPKKLEMLIDVFERDKNYAAFYEPLKDFHFRETHLPIN